MVTGAVLHWLVSQSLFLVILQYYDDSGPIADKFYAQLGYSAMAVIVLLVIGFITIIAGVLMGFRRYRGGMPLVGSCSAAISAACHQPKEDVDVADLPLMWGVVGEDATNTEYNRDEVNSEAPGHCCFTSLPISRPKEGRMYAG